MEKYIPANAVEFGEFAGEWCEKCAKNMMLCDIIFVAMVSCEFPDEWTCDNDGENPRCTAFAMTREEIIC